MKRLLHGTLAAVLAIGLADPVVAQRVSFATGFRDSKNKDLKVANVSRKKLV